MNAISLYYCLRTHFKATQMCDDGKKKKEEIFHRLQMKVKVGKVLWFITLITGLQSAANFFYVV